MLVSDSGNTDLRRTKNRQSRRQYPKSHEAQLCCRRIYAVNIDGFVEMGLRS